MQQLIEHYKQKYPDAGEQLTRVAPAMVAAHPEAMASFLAGMALMREDGERLVQAGTTSREELLRVTRD